MRLFLAHAKDVPDAQLDTLKATVQKQLPNDTVVLGRDDFKDRSVALGSWNAWVKEVATGRNFSTGGPLFDAIIVVSADEHVGRATAEIVKLAKNAGRQVLWTPDGTKFEPVAGVFVSIKDFKKGSVLELGFKEVPLPEGHSYSHKYSDDEIPF
jgi:hypothetical protein